MMKTTPPPKDPSSHVSIDRLHYFESHLDPLVKTIRELVELESPSDKGSPNSADAPTSTAP